MIILGIETSSIVCGLALSDGILQDVRPIAQIGLNIPNAHSEKIMLLMDELLMNSGIEKRNIEGIAVSIGPGSFTGLRIGLSTAKGLAYGLDVPVVGVPTLDVIAEKVKFLDKKLHVATSSRKNEYYYSSYLGGEKIYDYEVVSSEELVNRIQPDSALISDNAMAIVDSIPEKIRKSVLILEKDFAHPDAYYVAKLGYQKILNRQIDSLGSLVPMYVQEFRGSKV